MIFGEINNLPKNNTYSVWEYIIRIFSLILLASISFIILGNKSNPLNSFILSSVAFLIITIFASIILLKSRNWVWFFSAAYLIKLSIGLIHYLYFIDPSYFFSSGDNIRLHSEFEEYFAQIATFAHSKIQNGIFYFNQDDGWVTHLELLSFISIPFVFFGDNILTIAPINSMCSLIISINLILIAKYRLKIKNIKYIAIITAYFPISIISSFFFRDMVGFMLMSIGLNLILLSKDIIVKIIMLIIALYLFSLQRNIYAILLFVAFGIDQFIHCRSNNPSFDLLSKIAMLIFLIIIFPIILQLSLLENDQNQAMKALNVNLLLYPLKFIITFIGPFPWSQFLNWEKVPEVSYHLQQYIMGTFNIAMLMTFLQYRHSIFKKRNFNLLNIVGILIMISGLLMITPDVGYINEGFIFMIPWIATQINIEKFGVNFFYSFAGLIILNVFVILLFGNLGFASLWK